MVAERLRVPDRRYARRRTGVCGYRGAQMRIPTRADLTALLLRPLPYTKRRIPIDDPDPDRILSK